MESLRFLKKLLKREYDEQYFPSEMVTIGDEKYLVVHKPSLLEVLYVNRHYLKFLFLHSGPLSVYGYVKKLKNSLDQAPKNGTLIKLDYRLLENDDRSRTSNSRDGSSKANHWRTTRR